MALPHPPNAAEHDAASDLVEVLVVAFGASGTPTRVAVDASNVDGVARLERVTPYPGAPADVPGVTAVRGRVVAVLFLTPPDGATGPAVLVQDRGRSLALAGGGPTRVVGATRAAREAHDGASIRLWSGRELPVLGAVRLTDASRPDTAGGPLLPLLDTAALIAAAVDDSDGGR